MSDRRERILRELQNGLPLSPRPYLEIARKAGCGEQDVIAFIRDNLDKQVFSRFGLIVMHRTLGYTQNAMAVWDIPDRDVDTVAEQLANYESVNLCYRRPRVLPDWPYNLFCMIHAKSREFVYHNLASINTELNIGHCPNAVLFCEKAYKQRGARYV